MRRHPAVCRSIFRRSVFFETPTPRRFHPCSTARTCSPDAAKGRSRRAAKPPHRLESFLDQRQDFRQRFIEIAAGGERASQSIKRGGAFLAAAFRLFALAQLRGEMTDDERDHEIGAEHHEVVELADVKSEARRNEEKIPEQRAERGEKKRRPPAQTRCGENDREQIKKRDRPVTGVIEDRQGQLR